MTIVGALFQRISQRIGLYIDMRPLFSTPEKAEEWFTRRCMFPRVTPEEKRQILAIVQNEIARSKKDFGFTVEKRHVYSELYFFLCICDCAEGTARLRAAGFEMAAKYITEHMYPFFKETLVYYFERERLNGGATNKYQCHLESVRHVLLQEIFNCGLGGRSI